MNIEPLEARIVPATLLVTTLADSVADDGELSLREAVTAANGTPAADTIIFDPTLAGTLTLALGQIDITETLTILGSRKITLSGNNAVRILVVEDGNPAKDRPLTVSGLRFVDGLANTGAGQSGAAISSSEGLKIIDCIFEGNTGTLGGAVYVNAQGGTVAILRSHFTDNTATVVGGSLWAGSAKGITITDSVFADSVAKTGGGAYVNSNAVGAKVTISGSTFTGNTANGAQGNGGGLAIDGLEAGGKFSKLAISNSRFLDNTAPEGGGLFIGEGDFALSGLLVSGNTATNGGGGLFVGIATRAVSVTKSIFAGNTASGSDGGGGIFFDADAAAGFTATISATQFIGNEATAGSGGAIRTLDTGGKITVTGSLISGNTAASSGGGMALIQNDLTNPIVVTLTGNTISGNNANSAGGLLLTRYGDFILTKNVIAGNRANGMGGVDFDLIGDLTMKSNQVVGNRSVNRTGGMNFVADATSTFTNSGNVFAHNEGGETGGLSIGGDDAVVTIAKDTKITGNIAGSATNGGGVSVGDAVVTLLAPVLGNYNRVNAAADQIQGTFAGAPVPLPSVAANLTVTNLNDSGPGSLRDAIAQANAKPAADKIKFDDTLAGVVTLASQIAITDTLTIYGRGKITLSGNAVTRIFNVTDSDPTKNHPLTVSGLVFAKGKGGGAPSDSGAAIRSSEGLTVLDCLFVDNDAGVISGGAIFAEVGKATLTIKGSHFSDNKGGLGAGVFAASDKALTVTNTVFAQNIGSSDGGGANLVGRSVATTISVAGSVFVGNSSLGEGGGLAIQGFRDDGKASKGSVVHSIFTGGVAQEMGGGLQLEGGSFALAGVQIIGNSATTVGGGLAMGGSASKVLTVSKSVIAANTAAGLGGGGVSIQDNAVGFSATFTTTQILGNSAADGLGGGIFTPGITGKLIVLSSIVAGNLAKIGGGLGTSGTGLDVTAVVLTGNVIAGNEAETGGGLSLTGDGALALTKNSIIANLATTDAGGARLESTSTISLKTNSILANRSDNGIGGLLLRGPAAASFTTSGDVIAFNKGTTGGMEIEQAIAGIIAKSTKITGNLAIGTFTGGGITQESAGAVKLLATVLGNLNRTTPARNEVFGIFAA